VRHACNYYYYYFLVLFLLYCVIRKVFFVAAEQCDSCTMSVSPNSRSGQAEQPSSLLAPSSAHHPFIVIVVQRTFPFFRFSPRFRFRLWLRLALWLSIFHAVSLLFSLTLLCVKLSSFAFLAPVEITQVSLKTGNGNNNNKCSNNAKKNNNIVHVFNPFKYNGT